VRPAGEACPPAREPHRRTGGGRARLSPDRPAGCPRPRTCARRAEGPGHRRIGRRRDVRRADRQGLRRRSHRRMQHREDGPGPVHRRGPRDRLHARRRCRRSTPLRRDHRHRREPPAQAASRRPCPPRDAGHHRRRDRRPVARRIRPHPAGTGAVAVRPAAAGRGHVLGERGRPARALPAHRVRRQLVDGRDCSGPSPGTGVSGWASCCRSCSPRWR